jgi:hypothetical protein
MIRDPQLANLPSKVAQLELVSRLVPIAYEDQEDPTGAFTDNTQSVTFNVVSGRTYYIVVYGNADLMTGTYNTTEISWHHSFGAGAELSLTNTPNTKAVGSRMEYGLGVSASNLEIIEATAVSTGSTTFSHTYDYKNRTGGGFSHYLRKQTILVLEVQ